MCKKIIYIIFLYIILIPILVKASNNTEVMINGKYYDTLEAAIEEAGSNDIINLMSNVKLENSLEINKTININLNENNISAPTSIFIVKGGTLNITGKGTIKETEPNYGVIKVIGNKTPTNEKYSLVNINKDVTLEGWSGIFISHESSKSYGISINMDGKINAISDMNGDTGIGIYINGNIKEKELSPIINILDNAKIYSNGNGLYIAGYSSVYIKKAYIQGKESGIGIKSGILKIDGATIISDGKDSTPTEGYNNGIKASGTTIQIESNNGYAGNIELYIKKGNLKSKNSHVIYEYIGSGTNTNVKTISITGGTFISEAKKNIFSFSNSFKEKHPKFISGGSYSSNPNNYLISGYSSTLEDNLYTIIQSTMKEITNYKTTSNNKLKIILLILLLLIITILFLNKKNIINKIKRYKKC